MLLLCKENKEDLSRNVSSAKESTEEEVEANVCLISLVEDQQEVYWISTPDNDAIRFKLSRDITTHCNQLMKVYLTSSMQTDVKAVILPNENLPDFVLKDNTLIFFYVCL